MQRRRIVRRIHWILLAAVLTTPALAQFEVIRIGDVDGVGFGDGLGYYRSGFTCNIGNPPPSTCGTPVNLDGLGVLGDGDFLPDVDCDSCVGSNSALNGDGGDNFDNRSLEEAGTDGDGIDNFLTGIGFTDVGSSGSRFTDISLSDTYSVDPTGPRRFIFDFDIPDTEAPPRLFLNLVLGDYDNGTLRMDLTLGDSSTLSLFPSIKRTATSEDGQLRAGTVELPPGVVTCNAGSCTGYVQMDLVVGDPYYLVVDYVEVSTTRLLDCNDNGIIDRIDILNGTSADLDGDGAPDECDCERVRVSQESAPGLGDFDDNVLGCVDPYLTNLTGAQYYAYTNAFNGPAPPLTNDRSHLFLVRGSDGLSLFVVHDGIDGTAGRAEMAFELFGDADGAARTIEDGAPVTGDYYSGNPGDSLFASRHHWSNYTDGEVLSDLDDGWSMHVAFTPYTPSLEVISGLDSWAAYSGDGEIVDLALVQDRRVRLDCCGGCAPPPRDMVAWWPLDELGGVESADLVGPHAVFHLSNQPVREPGKVDGSVLFGAHEWTFVYNNPGSELSLLGTGEDDFSIDAWIRTSTASGEQTIFQRGVLQLQGYSFYLSDDRLGLFLANETTSSTFLSDPIPTLTDGNWHLVATTVERQDSVDGVRFYFDGNRVDPGNLDPTAITGPIVTPTSGAVIGMGNKHGFVDKFNGNLDEIEVFSRALPGTEIKRLFDAGEVGKCKIGCSMPETVTCVDDTANIEVELCNETPDSRDLRLGRYSYCGDDGSSSLLPYPAYPPPGDPVYGPYTVAGESCITVPVPMDCAGLTGELWRYGISLYQDVSNSYEYLIDRKCAIVRANSEIEVTIQPPPESVSSGMAPGQSRSVTFLITNQGAGSVDVDYSILGGPGVPGNRVVLSLDGEVPGVAVSGTVTVAPGPPVPVTVDAQFTEPDPGATHRVRLWLDLGRGGIEPAGSVPLRSSSVASSLPIEAGSVGPTLFMDQDSGTGDLLLSWGNSCSVTNLDYAVYEGNLGDFTSHVPAACSTLTTPVLTLPEPTGNKYYLVVPRVGTLEGDYGADSGGFSRPASLSSCAPQEAPTCF